MLPLILQCGEFPQLDGVQFVVRSKHPHLIQDLFPLLALPIGIASAECADLVPGKKKISWSCI